MSQSNPMLQTIVNSVMGVKETKPPIQSPINNQEIDGKAVVTYLVGTIVQIGLMISALWAMSQAYNRILSYNTPDWLPTAIASVFFIFLTIRSRLFSPLDNTRNSGTYKQIIRPSWAPPPLAFPIIWMSIGVLRVVSSVLVWQEMEANFLAFPLILYVIHLALGDTWNTIFTVERRFGAAFPVVILGPWLSAIIVTIIYGQTISLAGFLLLPSVIWLTVACVLVYGIWQLNGREPFYPTKREIIES
ncbi:TspO/MBR family protein [Crocosphaera sp. Alani8]|uniref:TspO/MBR family protein n=1 Tax=Crocosphaera sp. Alani8 TaxID=3038952 RepID=UPI00313DF210